MAGKIKPIMLGDSEVCMCIVVVSGFGGNNTIMLELVLMLICWLIIFLKEKTNFLVNEWFPFLRFLRLELMKVQTRFPLSSFSLLFLPPPKLFFPLLSLSQSPYRT